MILDKLRSDGIRITSINDMLHVIHGNNRSRTPYANAFLVLDETNVLLDSGCGHEIINTLCRQVVIDKVINSHSHPDHTSGNWLLKEISSPEIYVPGNNIESISHTELLAARLVGEELSRLWIEAYLPATGFQDFEPSSSFTHGHEFKTGRSRFIALYTPGHLGDHYCLYEPDDHILIGFDIDLSPFGPWYGNPECDIPSFKRSIDEVLAIQTDIYLSSHAKPIKAPYIAKRLSSYASHFQTRDKKLLACLSNNRPTSLDELVRLSPFYGADYSVMDKILFYGEEQMIAKHLSGLLAKGLIVQEGDFYRISDKR